MTPQFILDAIRDEIEKITIDECKKAELRVRERVAAAASAIAVTVMHQIRVESRQDEIVIRVDTRKL